MRPGKAFLAGAAFLLAALLLLAASAPAVRALDALTLKIDAEIRVPPVQRLDATPGVLAFPSVGLADLERGWLDLPRPAVLSLSSNVPWTLSARRAPGSGPEPDASGSAEPVLWVRAESGERVPLGEEWRAIATGDGPAADVEVPLEIRLELDWNRLPPGRHEPRIEYRLEPGGTS